MKHIFQIIFIMLLTTTCLSAQDHPGEEPYRATYGKGSRFAQLNLSLEQRDKLQDIKVSTKKKIIPLKADIELKQIDLKQAFKADTPDRNRIMDLIEDLADLQLQVRKIKADMRLDMLAQLTPEQREKLQAVLPSVMRKKKAMKKY